MRMTNKVALVIGGIDRETALLFVREGARMVIAGGVTAACVAPEPARPRKGKG